MFRPDVKTYDLDQVGFSFAGVPISGGYGEGSSILIKRNAPLYLFKVGRAGDVVRSRNNDKTGTVELTLLQAEAANSTLNTIRLNDEYAANGAGIGAFLCRDRSNGDEYYAAEAWIHELPETEFGQETTDRKWVLICANLEFHPGGRL